MSTRCRFWVFLMPLLLLTPDANAVSLQHLQNDEAKKYIGDLQTRLTRQPYIYEILKRSHRDTKNGRFSDAVIFTKETDRLFYKKRSDGKHEIVVAHPDGRQEDPVTTDAVVWRPIQNTLQDDHPYPHVFLNSEGKELAIVYIGRKTRLSAKLNDEGRLVLSIQI